MKEDTSVDTSAITQHNNSKIATLTCTGRLTPAFFNLMIESVQDDIHTLQTRLNCVTARLQDLQPPVMPEEYKYLFNLIYKDDLNNQFDVFTIEEMDVYLLHIQAVIRYKLNVQNIQRQIADIRSKMHTHKMDLYDYQDMLEIVNERTVSEANEEKGQA